MKYGKLEEYVSPFSATIDGDFAIIHNESKDELLVFIVRSQLQNAIKRKPDVIIE